MNAASEQLILDLGHRTALGREDFLVSSANADAVAWIDRWPSWPSPALVLHGPAACGKTHMAAVWCAQTGGIRIDYNDMLEKSADTLAEMGQHLALEQADLWVGERVSETKLFHLYNIMKEEGRTLLLTMRAAPSGLDFSLPDLASRLRAAPSVSVSPPDDALLSAILVKLFSDRQIQLGCDILGYVLPRMERSFAAAHDLVTRADHLAMAEKRGISIPLMRRVLMEGL